MDRAGVPYGSATWARPADLLTFARLVLDGGPLVETMLTPQATWPEMPGVNSQYGLGWVVTEVDSEVSAGHGGGSPGTAALLRVHPSRQLALAVCLNSTESAAPFFADFIGGWLAATFGTPAWRNPVPPEQARALDLAAYEGAYRRSAITHRMRFDGGSLWLQTSGADGQ